MFRPLRGLYDLVQGFVYRTIQPDAEADGTKLTVLFDAVIMLLIGVSVVIVFVVTFELPPAVMETLKKAEQVIVIVFTGEYLLRLWTANRRYPSKSRHLFLRILLPRLRYVFSVVAIVDLLAILPSYLPYLLPEGMLGIRALRLMRLLRIGKVTQHSRALSAITGVIKNKAKDLVAVLFFMSLVVLFLSLLIETFTKSGTRGFYPVTTLGRIVGAVISVLGICLIAIPTGIISSGLIEQLKSQKSAVGQGGEGEEGNQASCRPAEKNAAS